MGGIAEAGKAQSRGTMPQNNNRSGGRRSNWRTALALSSIALVFFIGVIINRLLFN